MIRGQYFKAVLLLVSALGLQSFQAQGAAAVTTEHASVTLLAEESRAVAGKTLWLGLHFELIPQWHVYWRNKLCGWELR